MSEEQRNWYQWFKTRLAELVMAALVVFLVVQVRQQIEFRAEQAEIADRQAVPASAWFQLNEIFIPDHRVGENPDMIYDRTVLENFRGFFVAELQRQQPDGLWFAACSGSGASDYETTDVIPDRTTTFFWFLNRECVVAPGTYRVRVSWDMKRVDWPTKNLVAISNLFQITP